jgi:hypothetical protein
MSKQNQIDVRMTALIFALCMPLLAAAQPASSAAQDLSRPEEIVITGQRYQLYKLMLEAEKNAYETFNKFNDEKRFTISCSVHKPTGSQLSKQSCTPEFEIQATQAHAQDYYRNLRNLLNPAPGEPETDGNVSQAGAPMEMMISKDLPAYRQKLKQIAEQHPEFLESIVKYTKVKEKYEGAGRE